MLPYNLKMLSQINAFGSPSYHFHKAEVSREHEVSQSGDLRDACFVGTHR